jgi:WD40 repeat protein
MLAGGSRKGVIIIWNTNTGQQIARIESKRGEISDLAFDDQEGTVIAASREGYILTWELSSLLSN